SPWAARNRPREGSTLRARHSGEPGWARWRRLASLGDGVRTAVLFVLLAGTAFATSGPLARYARPADPLVVALGRLPLAALVLLALDARALLSSLRALSRKQTATVFGAGAILAAHFACFQWGLEHTSLPAAVSLVSLEPLSVVLVAWALFKIRPTWSEQLG